MAPFPASTPDPSPISPSTEVPWQTCFWIIVTLALNTMAQPSGKTISFPARNSIYLRSSPVIAVADVLSIPIRILYVSIDLTVSPRKALGLYWSWRFEDYDYDDAEHGELANFEKSTWLRWLLLILGPLPQALRLASFGGIIWTKLFGFGFLISWFVVDALLYFAARHQEKIRQGAVRAPEAELSPDQLLRYQYSTLSDLDDFFTRIIAIAGLCSPMVAFYHLLVQFGLPPATESEVHGSYRENLLVLLAYLGFVVFGFACWYGTIGLISCFEKFPGLARYFLVMRSRRRGLPEDFVDDDSVACLFFFLINVGSLILSYSVGYDRVGTTNPGWATVFG